LLGLLCLAACSPSHSQALDAAGGPRPDARTPAGLHADAIDAPGGNPTLPAGGSREATAGDVTPAAADAEADAAVAAAGDADAAPPRAAEDARPADRPIRVGFYQARGVSEDALGQAMLVLRNAGGFDVAALAPEQIRDGALAERDVAVFSGGIGSTQGALLEPAGRRIVREFVAGGGGYVGICAGSYLAIQGPPQYNHVAIVAARNWSDDAWKRGVAMLDVRPLGGDAAFQMFYANGPVFRRDTVEGLAPFVPLAEFVSDKYCLSCGTQPGELPGTPAILAASYRAGRILLFSPNPVLAQGTAAPHPELFVAAVRWAADRGPVAASLRWSDVFPETR
jgi:putative intracellular protease/amidase